MAARNPLLTFFPQAGNPISFYFYGARTQGAIAGVGFLGGEQFEDQGFLSR